MPQSSCLCGNIKVSFTGEPVAKVSQHEFHCSDLVQILIPSQQFMCSCLDDRKITGSLFGATNLMIPTDGLQTTQGTLKTYAKIVESGNNMVSFFCGDCGSTIYRESSGYPGVVMIKAGCVDDLDAEDMKPQLEMYHQSHAHFLPAIDGMEQKPRGLDSAY